MEIMGNTKSYLIMPVAIRTMIPALVAVSAVLGILGGRMAGMLTGILSAATFDKGLHQL